MSNLPIGYSLNLAVIRNVEKTFVEFKYLNDATEKLYRCPIPYPYAGRGSGIFAGYEKDVIVIVSTGPNEQPFIVGTIPDRNLYFDQSGINNAPISNSEYPNINPGEICLKSISGSRVDVKNDGNISIDSGIGDDSADLELSSLSKALFIRTDNVYTFTEAGRQIEGVIRRDLKEEESKEDTETYNFLTGELYDNILQDIGRSPKDEVQLRTTKILKETIRNPALVEKRSIVYEFANTFGVRALPIEAKATEVIKNEDDIISNISDIKIDWSARENRRTDILDLNLYNYNHLIEKTEGTVVDIYGNVLDINRNAIQIPSLNTTDVLGSNLEDKISKIYDYLRRSIKYHFEINSRKSGVSLEPSIETPGYKAKDHSRWFLDIDGEGLTKINIPASSETGNIPILGRYVVSRGELNKENNSYNGSFKEKTDPQKRDISVIPFSELGPTTKNSSYLPSANKKSSNKTVNIGTAYHNILNIASSIFNNGKLKDPNLSGGNKVDPISSEVDNEIGSSGANAGGRSINANLDGSAEISIGADSVDRKSLVLDLAGGVISHYGRDKNGRSLIHQTDGDVIIQIGGIGIPDSRFNDTSNRPGRVEIHLNRSGTSQKILIDENGITFDIQGAGVFKTSGDMSLVAGGNLLLHGMQIFEYGATDVDKRVIAGQERLNIRNGNVII